MNGGARAPEPQVEVLRVRVWGRDVGAVAADPARRTYAFEYEPSWRRRGLDLSPILMPRTARSVLSFPHLPESFRGLPPMLADALPDKFGNQLIEAVLAREGLTPERVSPLDRLAYVGRRAMGALTFEPDQSPTNLPTVVELSTLVETARAALQGNLSDPHERSQALAHLVAVGTSAGGARAKAVVAWNRATGDIRAGNLPVPDGFEQWLVKLDGVGPDSQLGDSGHYGRIEYAYHLMAREAGMDMAECHLIEEGPRAHFATRRFDRPGTDGRRLHMQSLSALTGMDYDAVGVHDYASLFTTAAALGLEDQAEQLFRRAAFNVLASNCDDHPKNFAFLMDEQGTWSLAPAYDLTFAYAPGHRWLSQHLMGVEGKHHGITVEDLLTLAARFAVPHPRQTLAEVAQAVRNWPAHARTAGVPDDATTEVATRLERVWQDTGMTGRWRPATDRRPATVTRYRPGGQDT